MTKDHLDHQREFTKRVKEHLGHYKQNEMKLDKKGVYEYCGKSIEYPYILHKDDYQFNIFEQIRTDFFNDPKMQSIKRHRYFHHLNSSQAMCINFFYPLIVSNQKEILLRALFGNECDDEIAEACFEKVSDLERYLGEDVFKNSGKSKRILNRTNFDFYLETLNGKRIYFEIKYTEAAFGKAYRRKQKDFEKYQKKFKCVYEPLLENNPALKDKYKCKDEFFDNYQIMRNLIHIDEDSYVVFVYPEMNDGISKGVCLAKESIVTQGWKDHFIPITWETLWNKVSNEVQGSRFENYYKDQFKKKYLV